MAEAKSEVNKLLIGVIGVLWALTLSLGGYVWSDMKFQVQQMNEKLERIQEDVTAIKVQQSAANEKQLSDSRRIDRIELQR